MFTILIFILLTNINLKLKCTTYYASVLTYSQTPHVSFTLSVKEWQVCCMNRLESDEDDNIYFITALTHKNGDSAFPKH